MRRALTSILAILALGLVACGGTDTPADLGGDAVQPDVPVTPSDDGGATDLPADRPGTDLGDDPGPQPDDGNPPDDTPVTDEGGKDDGPNPDEGPDVPPVGCQEGERCDDGNACTHGEKCDAAGACVGGTAYACDDKRDCTDDTCDGLGDCVFTIQAEMCLIDGRCYAKDQPNPLNTCQACKPGAQKATQTGWGGVGEGEFCDPTALLGKCEESPSGSCVSGACVPDVKVDKGCDDANPCTNDACDPVLGCLNKPVSGANCNLGDACKPGVCNQGHCIIPADVSCDDGNPCTDDTCDPTVGCVYTDKDLVPCTDGSACSVEDTCVQGVCQGLEANCDDGNVCTVDGCDNISGCWHDVANNPCCDGGVSKCDDGNPCTNDDCDPITMDCINTNNTAACNDRDPCTVNDSCDQGDCSGVSKNCSDGNPCTADSCSATGVCLHTPETGTACDDGIECSSLDHCEAGKCVGDLATCKCTIGFSPAVSKFVSMTSYTEGKPGTGLDLDSDPSTCSPWDPPCSGGVDNALGPILGMSLVQDALVKAVADGKVMILLEHRGLRTDGGEYTLGVFIGKLDPANDTCNYQTMDCGYIVDRQTVDTNADDSPCPPVITIDNAKIVGNKLTAGGRGYTFPFDLPLFEGVNLHIDLYLARIEATVTVSGGKVTSMTGLLGGAVPKQQLIDAINAVPDEQFKDVPGGKAGILPLVDALVEPDIDGDGDGNLESASLNIKFGSIAGRITGVY